MPRCLVSGLQLIVKLADLLASGCSIGNVRFQRESAEGIRITFGGDPKFAQMFAATSCGWRAIIFFPFILSQESFETLFIETSYRKFYRK